MSVTINTLASDITTLYQQALLNASYGGVGFYVIDGSDEAGRRLQRFLFPGQDAAAFQDLGQMDGEIELKGVLVGDDFIQQAQRMRAVFYTPGPQTLTHPWLGEIQVVQSPGKLPKFSFTHDEIRIARFTLCVLRYTPAQPPAPNTLQSVLDAIEDAQLAVNQFLAQTLAPVVLTLAGIGAVQGFVNLAATEWTVLTSSAKDAAVAPAATAPIAAMGTVATVTVDANYGTNIAGLLGGVPAAIAGTSTPIIPAAVAPGGSTATPVAVDDVHMSRTEAQAQEGVLALLPDGWTFSRDVDDYPAALELAVANEWSLVEETMESFEPELDPGTAQHLLPDYLQVLGPDPYGREDLTLSSALQSLLAHQRWVDAPIICPGYFVESAAELGLSITIVALMPST